MDTTTSATPTIRRAATSPPTPRKLFVNIPVTNLQRSIDFFEALGFAFNRHELRHWGASWRWSRPR